MDGRADPDELDVGDRVRWEASGGRAYGEVEVIERDGALEAEPEGPEMEGTEDNPAYGVRVYDIGTEGEWEATDTLTVHRADALTIIDEFPEARMDSDTERMEALGQVADDMERCASRLREMMGATRNGPYVKRSAEKGFARHCRDTGDTYYRDFGSWDGPAPQLTRASTEDRVDVTINTASEDRHGTIILPTGASLERYNELNPIVLINHEYGLVAGTSQVAMRGEGLDARIQAQMEDAQWDRQDPRVQPWFNKVTADPPIVRSASIGALLHDVVPGRDFDGIEQLIDTDSRPPRKFPDVATGWELVEWSWVSVPSNPEATMARGTIDRIAREAEARMESAVESMQRAAELNRETQTTSVPTEAGRFGSGGTSSSEPNPSATPSDGDSTSPDEGGEEGTSRRLSGSEAKKVLNDAVQDRLDKLTGRK
jgi:hypothetical protein